MLHPYFYTNVKHTGIGFLISAGVGCCGVYVCVCVCRGLPIEKGRLRMVIAGGQKVLLWQVVLH